MIKKVNSSDSFIIGASGFAAEVHSWLVASTDHIPAGFVVADDRELSSPVNGVACYHEKDLTGVVANAYVAIGDPKIRQVVVEKLKLSTGFQFPNLVHYTAIIHPGTLREEGNLLMPFSILCPLTKIGSFNIINIYGSLGHDAILGNFNTLSPYATLSGSAVCEDLCFLGSHATLGPGVRMKSGSSLSANSFGNKDIPENGLAFGVPAKIVGKRTNDE